MGVLRRLGTRLAQPPEQLRAQEVREFCREIHSISQIAECRPRQQCRVAGIVQSIKYVPSTDASILEVTIYDGTDRIAGTWYGRKQIPGIRLGQPMILGGTIVSRRAGILEMINPAYELVAAEF